MSEDGGDGAPQQGVTAVDATDAAQADQSEGQAEAQDQVSGDEEDEGRDAPAPSGDYERDLTNIVDDVKRRLDEAADEFQRAIIGNLDGVDLSDEEAVNEAFAGAFGDFLPRSLSILENGLEALEDLDPPDRFEEDHNRLIAGLREITRFQEESLDAALEADFDFRTDFDDLAAEVAALETALSPEFLVLVASLFEDDEEDEGRDAPAPSGDYERDLTNIVDDLERRFDEADDEFQRAFLRSLDGVDLEDEEAVNEALASVLSDFVPRGVSILENGLEALEGLDPPDRFEEDHDRFIAGVREIRRLAQEGLDAVLEGGFDFETGFDGVQAETDALEAELERELSPEFFALVASFFPDDDEAQGGDAPALSGDYERDLTSIVDDVLRRLLVAGLEFLTSLNGLDLDDEEALNEARRSAVGDFAARFVNIVKNELEGLEELDPPDRFEEDHNRFIAGVHEIRRLQQEGFDTALEPGFDFETSFDDLDAEGAAEVAALEAELKRELSPAFNLLVTSFFANDDEGDAPAPSGDSGGTGSDGGGNADSGNGAVSSAIPAALIHPDGPGGWTSTPTPEGTLFKAGFSLDPNSDIEEVLDFYVDAFASLGAPTVTSRLVTPISGEVEASGPGGRGSVQIFAAPGIIGLQAEFLQFE